jgi:hypothetical protein
MPKAHILEILKMDTHLEQSSRQSLDQSGAQPHTPPKSGVTLWNPQKVLRI